MTSKCKTCGLTPYDGFLTNKEKFEGEDEIACQDCGSNQTYIRKKQQKGCGKMTAINDFQFAPCGQDWELCPECSTQSPQDTITKKDTSFSLPEDTKTLSDKISRHPEWGYPEEDVKTFIADLNGENKKDLDKIISEVINVKSKWTSEEVISVLSKLHYEQSENSYKLAGSKLLMKGGM